MRQRKLVVLATLCIFFLTTSLDGRSASAAAPYWLQISGNNLKVPLIVPWEDTPEIRSLDWMWSLGCVGCNTAKDLLRLDSPYRVWDEPTPQSPPYELSWYGGTPVPKPADTWKYYPPLGGQDGYLLLEYHWFYHNWEGIWFKPPQQVNDFLVGILLYNGCPISGRIPCLPRGEEAANHPWPVIR